MSYLSKEKNPSFSGLFDHTDNLKKRVLKAREDHRYEIEYLLIEIFTEYYEDLKKSSRLKTQTDYCRQVMEELFPAYCKGYFKRRK